MAHKVRVLVGQINDLTLNPPKLRAYKMVYALTSNTKNNSIHISQQELANILGIHRVTLNRIIVDLKNAGIIQEDISKKRITLSNPQKLLLLIEKEQESGSE